MKLIRFVAFLFYRYYSEGRWAVDGDTAFFRAKCSMTAIAYMHFLTVLACLNKVDLIPINPSDNKLVKRVIIFLVMLPIYLLLTSLIKKRHMDELGEKYATEWDKIFNANVWLIVYMVFSFALLMVLAVIRK